MDWVVIYWIGYLVAFVVGMTDDKTKEKYPVYVNIFSYVVLGLGSWLIPVMWFVENYKCDCKEK